MSRPVDEVYTPGHAADAVAFMARRRAATHAAFFTPLLAPGMRVLDCACGPGTITLDLGRIVRPGEVVGLDQHGEQAAGAHAVATREGLAVRFVTGSVYALPFPDASFDAVFSHALFEHLREPRRAAEEIQRVLKPAGVFGVRSPDWGGYLLHPYPREVAEAIVLYEQLQVRNGGDVFVGRKLPSLLRAAGFDPVKPSASYQIYEDPTLIASYLAARLERAEHPTVAPSALGRAARALRAWSRAPEALFAQAWVEAIGRAPSPHP